VWKGRNSGAQIVSEEAVVHVGCAGRHSLKYSAVRPGSD